jgi:hypothetical protein
MEFLGGILIGVVLFFILIMIKDGISKLILAREQEKLNKKIQIMLKELEQDLGDIKADVELTEEEEKKIKPKRNTKRGLKRKGR